MSWETPVDKVRPYMPMYGRCEVLDGCRPLRPHRATRPRQRDGARVHGGRRHERRRRCRRSEMLRHGKIDLALHHLRPEPTVDGVRHAAAPPRSRRIVADGRCRRASPGGRVPIAALDFTGHGRSSVPHGGGYTAELLLADADAALGALDRRRPGAAGDGRRARPRRLHRTAVGRAAGRASCAVRSSPTGPASPAGRPGRRRRASSRSRPTAPRPTRTRWSNSSRDLRPPDYAASFVRLALGGSPLDEPIAVCAVIRPEWLVAVANEHGVMTSPSPKPSPPTPT